MGHLYKEFRVFASFQVILIEGRVRVVENLTAVKDSEEGKSVDDGHLSFLKSEGREVPLRGKACLLAL